MANVPYEYDQDAKEQMTEEYGPVMAEAITSATQAGQAIWYRFLEFIANSDPDGLANFMKSLDRHQLSLAISWGLWEYTELLRTGKPIGEQ